MQNKGLILVFSTALISGVSIFINQFGVKVINPYIFTGLKNIIVALFLVAIIFFLKESKQIKKLAKKDWLKLSLIGLVGGSVPFLMFFKGLTLSTGAEASYLHKFMFVFLAILAPLYLKEKLRWHYLIGLVFLLVGSILLFQIQGIPQLSLGTNLILGASFLWAIENMISKQALKNIPPKIVAWGRMSFGSLFIITYWIFTSQASLVLDLQMNQLVWVLVTAALLCGYVFTWYSGLKYLPVTYASAILALGAPITSLLQLIQGKEFVASQVWGMGIMFSGIILFIVIDRILCSRSLMLPNTQ